MHEIKCEACYGTGEWECECCNGSGGCSCRGQPVPMGACRVCGGTGMRDESADTRANIRAVQGFGFLGTGPSGGLYERLPRMGLPGRR